MNRAGLATHNDFVDSSAAVAASEWMSRASHPVNECLALRHFKYGQIVHVQDVGQRHRAQHIAEISLYGCQYLLLSVCNTASHHCLVCCLQSCQVWPGSMCICFVGAFRNFQLQCVEAGGHQIAFAQLVQPLWPGLERLATTITV